MKPSKTSAAVIVMSLVLLSGCGINNIPTYDESVSAAWSQVENQYQRRAELIPNLVKTVKGFADHEKDVLTSVVEARAKASSMQLPKDVLSNPEAFKQFQAAQDGLSSALSRLMVVVERYPDLKSNENFLALQTQLEGTENRISVARKDYIGAVKTYNTELRTFPGRIWHTVLYSDQQAHETFTAPKGSEKVPDVAF